MRVLINIFLILFLGATVSAQNSPKIILDTDFGGDVDDLGALAMIHHFVDKNECELLGVVSWTLEQYSVNAIDAVNNYYGHSDVPVGVRQGDSHYCDWCYNKVISDIFPHQKTKESAWEAINLYRKLLAEAEDNSVTIVTIGPLKNLENLLNSDRDEYSNMKGRQLVQQKVKEFVIMGGQFPEGTFEWNFNGDMVGVTKNVIEQIDVPITFIGYEVGEPIKTGLVFNSIDRNSPLFIGWLHFSNHAPWMTNIRTGSIIDNSTFDQTAILYAVRGGIGKFWNRVEGGKCIPDEAGGNKWVKDASSNHSYLKLIMDEEEIAGVIEDLMLGKE